MSVSPMSPKEFRETLSFLDLTPRKAADVLGIGERNARRWAKDGGVPRSVALLLRALMLIKLEWGFVPDNL